MPHSAHEATHRNSIVLLRESETPPAAETGTFRYSRATAGFVAGLMLALGGALLAVGRVYDNPYFVLNEYENTSELNRIVGNTNIDYIPFDWLTVKHTFGVDYYTVKQGRAGDAVTLFNEWAKPLFTEQHSRGRRELEIHRGISRASGSGKSARYFTLRRGSAIIGSAASRHAA